MGRTNAHNTVLRIRHAAMLMTNRPFSDLVRAEVPLRPTVYGPRRTRGVQTEQPAMQTTGISTVSNSIEASLALRRTGVTVAAKSVAVLGPSAVAASGPNATIDSGHNAHSMIASVTTATVPIEVRDFNREHVVMHRQMARAERPGRPTGDRAMDVRRDRIGEIGPKPVVVMVQDVPTAHPDPVVVQTTLVGPVRVDMLRHRDVAQSVDDSMPMQRQQGAAAVLNVAVLDSSPCINRSPHS